MVFAIGTLEQRPERSPAPQGVVLNEVMSTTNKPISTSDAKKLYELYAKNIDVRHLQVSFDDAKPIDVHGASRSTTSKHGVSLHCVTMRTTDQKNKV